jgi:alpha-beta hydrolase superfamily lysophospholipase
VLQSTFTSIPDVGSELLWWLPVRWLNTIKYETHAKLPRVKVPVLVMHSREDSMVRFHHAEENFAAANEPKLFQEMEGGHNDSLFLEPGLGAKGLEKFLQLVESQAKESGK